MDEQNKTFTEEQTGNGTSQEEKGGRWYIESSIADILPSMVKVTLSKMSEEKQSMFVEEFKRKKKSLGLAFFFLIICLGMPEMGVANCLLADGNGLLPLVLLPLICFTWIGSRLQSRCCITGCS